MIKDYRNYNSFSIAIDIKQFEARYITVFIQSIHLTVSNK